jgi:anhydro-N-acetylmuramic acid kinase
MNSALYIGLMSGTSMDGVDGVLVTFDADARMTLRVVAHSHLPFDAELSAAMLDLNSSGADELHRAMLAANQLARHYGACVEALLSSASLEPRQVKAIGAHGQTVRHRPGEFDGTGYSIQLNAPALLAESTGIDVVCDFRSRDIAAGGQGAPLVPAFHRAMFGELAPQVAVLNLGGIANLTVLTANQVTHGFDCGPANALMDHWCQLMTGARFDAQGAWARSGAVEASLLAALQNEPYFLRAPPKSTGRDLFNAQWLRSKLSALASSVAPQDVQATLAELMARVCAADVLACAPSARLLVVCGGGAFNAYLLERLSACLPGVVVCRSDDHGLPATQVEACAFAWLARAFIDREPASLPVVTGACGARILGALYPGR